MSDEIVFGIGCFHFGVRATPPFSLNGQDYIDKLQKTLESIPNISNIEIKADDEFKSATSQIDEELSAINEGVDFFQWWGAV